MRRLDELGEHARGILEMREFVMSIEAGGPLVQRVHRRRASCSSRRNAGRRLMDADRWIHSDNHRIDG